MVKDRQIKNVVYSVSDKNQFQQSIKKQSLHFSIVLPSFELDFCGWEEREFVDSLELFFLRTVEEFPKHEKLALTNRNSEN